MNFHKLHESIIDDPQPSENPYVWLDGKINPLIRVRVVDLLTEKKIPFREIMIIGSITTIYWSENSDIDITVFCDANEKELLSYRKLARVMSERNFFGIFPMNFYFRTDNPQDIQVLADGIYDLLRDKWVKEPASLDAIEEAIKNPKKLAERIAKKLDLELDEISDDIVEILNRYKDSNYNLDDKLNFLELELQNYVADIDEIHKKRVESFTNALEQSNFSIIKKYGSANLLPYNIIFKLLQKWLYTRWASIFKDTLKTDDIKMKEIKILFEKFVKYWI